MSIELAYQILELTGSRTAHKEHTFVIVLLYYKLLNFDTGSTMFNNCVLEQNIHVNLRV